MLCLLLVMAMPVKGHAAGLSIIRDTEIENVLREWIKPLTKAANMQLDQINMVLVGSNKVNAFVAGGPNIFLYTGIILEADTPDEVIGVLAHELGHIEGGHLVRGRVQARQASYQSLLSSVLGIGIAVLSKRPEAASAATIGGSSVAARRYLSFSRAQESSADQAALKYFEAAGFSPQGLVDFMEKLEGQELLSASRQSEYMRTHPLTRDRVEALKNGLETSPHQKGQGGDLSPEWQDQFERIKAKIIAYQDPPRAIGLYGNKFDTIHGLYALCIVDYRQGRLEKALKRVDELLKKEPDNPYFHEFKGQILLEDGQAKAAIKSYEKAIEILPNAGLIRIDLAQAMLTHAGYDNRKLLGQAQAHLKRAQKTESSSSKVNRLLATIYGRIGNESLAQLYLAEEAILQRNFDDARRFAKFAEQGIKKGSRDWLHLQDVLQYLEQQ